MLNTIKTVFRKMPNKLYRYSSHCWHDVLRVLETQWIGTRWQEWVWKTRHLYKGKKWAIEYLHSTDHPHREQIVTEISSCFPFDSVLEIGCNSGPNLLLLSQKYPNVSFNGVDINAVAIAAGAQYIKENNIKNISLLTGKADVLSFFDDKSVDVVFTDAMLMFIGKDKIIRVINEIGRIARKAIILNEYHSKTPLENNYDGGRWVYNYEKLIQECFPKAIINLQKSTFIGDAWDTYGTLITVKL